MIQSFVPKGRLTPHMGKPDLHSVSLATVFGAVSSSCSFAALAAARALMMKGAHFVAAVAFMFASTNLVIELGVLILIFLGWQFLPSQMFLDRLQQFDPIHQVVEKVQAVGVEDQHGGEPVAVDPAGVELVEGFEVLRVDARLVLPTP